MTQKALINNAVIVNSTVASGDIPGDTISCAFDFTNKLFWFTSQAMRAQYGANAWNNSNTANPGAGVGGLPMSSLTPGTGYLPAFGDLEGNVACMINTGASGFLVPLPSRFNSWGGTGASTVAPPAAPTAVLAGTTTANSVPLSWNAAVTGGSATSYQVQYALTGTTVFYNGPVVTTTNAVVTGLIPNTPYTFQVFGINSGGNGPLSGSITAPTIASLNPLITYRGLVVEGSDLTAIASLPAVFSGANSIIIPVFCSTASQTSTDVILITTIATISGWIQTASTAGYNVFLGIYLNPRDGSPRQTINPGPSAAGVQTFMTNLSAICQQVAQLGALNNLVGMFCGIELQPWAGVAAGDTGPFSATNVSLWHSIYTACKVIWPNGIISYAAMQSSLHFSTPSSAFAANWSFWDAIGVDLYPGSNNTFTTTSQFQTYFQTQPDPDAATVASVGQVPLIQALINYSNSVGRAIIVVQCGIIPADGNQTLPGQSTVLPPPFDFNMQSAWWQAVMATISANSSSFLGFFAQDAGTNGFSSAFSGVNYWGIQGTPSAAIVNQAFAALTGTSSTLVAPINFASTSITTTSISVGWSAVPGTGVTYVVQYAPTGVNTFTNLASTSLTTATVPNLTPNTAYVLKVFAQIGGTIGPASAPITVSTTAVPQAITIDNIGNIANGATFLVSGTLVGFPTAPPLTYTDDPVVGNISGLFQSHTDTSISLSWSAATSPTQIPLPTGSTVSNIKFSFIHPSLPAGTHVIDVTNGTVAASATYTVANPIVLTPTITLASINAIVGSSFIVDFTLANFPTIPTLVFADDGGNSVGLGATTAPNGEFQFSHPAWTAVGNHTISIFVSSTPSIVGTANYTVKNLAVPGAVTAIALLSKTLTTESISWNPPDALQTYSYNVAHGPSATGPFPAPVNVNTTTFAASGLTQGTNYFWQVTAQGTTGLVGPATVGGPFATLTGTLPSLPANIGLIGGINQITVDLTKDANSGTSPVTYNISTGTSASGPFTLQKTSVSGSTPIVISVPG